MKIKHKEDPIPHRRSSYHYVGDQLDAIYKGFVAIQNQGIKLPKETEDWINYIASIKEKFPHH
ncbi:hypothetical protein [Oligella sp. HMSC09E12]|uniref:hypothetical protein n=1 Tax=Oligella sp. HMSC09E12 TaxID=1581147 RepID=UPI0008A56886|nr:hypothetical protein [Oligella sp. HMSC09E12]OFV46701.1 hypothetical protein HMPREF3179_09400 [Oligella sp. HMSC09E12]